MPKYHYLCKNCKTDFFKYHKINEIINCDTCKSNDLERIIKNINFEIPSAVIIGEELLKVIEENKNSLDNFKKEYLK